MVGEAISHYRILEKLGAGGMGEVYRAHDVRLDRDVALKVLPAGTLADETARRRFRREAMTLSQLNHPNIAVVHDFDTEDGVDFLAMEYVAGDTLGQKLSGGPLVEKEVIALGTQIAEALEEAHEHDVIHRDLKPGNVMVTAKGRVKVLDFGLAKLVRPPEADAATASLAETQAGTVMGTVPYMAPEQLQGKVVDARADVYALGAVLYEMATGRRPFPEKQTTQLVAAILTQAAQPPRELNGEVSAGLEAVILNALEKDPARRYPSAKELLGDLGRLSVPGSVVVAAQRPTVRRRWVLAAVAASLVLLMAILVGLDVGGLRDRLLTTVGVRRAVPLPKIHSLAVLPLENLSGDAGQDYFADGMTEELITNLAKISALKVISRTSVMHYKGTTKTVPEIAKELNVDGVVEGSVQRSGNRVRITAQLVDARSDTHLWAESYQREMQSILALQGEVAQAIAREVRTKVSPQEQARLASARPVIATAHEAYLKGRFHLHKGTEEGFRKGLNYFLEALQKDPQYAPAFAGIADAYLSLGNYSVLPAEETYPKAKAAALRALEIDDNLAESHLSLATVKHLYDWDQAGAEREYRRALELSPNDAETRTTYVMYLTHMGRYDEAISEAKHAEELDPLSLTTSAIMGIAFHCARRYAEGIEEYHKVLELEPNASVVQYQLARAYINQGMYNEAITLIKKRPVVSGGFPEANFLSILGVAYGFSGKKNEARSVLKSLEAKRAKGFVRPYMMAENYAALGEKDRALDWLEKACDERDDWVVWLKVDPNFDRLRSQPRFQALLRRMNFPE